MNGKIVCIIGLILAASFLSTHSVFKKIACFYCQEAIYQADDAWQINCCNKIGHKECCQENKELKNIIIRGNKEHICCGKKLYVISPLDKKIFNALTSYNTKSIFYQTLLFGATGILIKKLALGQTSLPLSTILIIGGLGAVVGMYGIERLKETNPNVSFEDIAIKWGFLSCTWSFILYCLLSHSG